MSNPPHPTKSNPARRAPVTPSQATPSTTPSPSSSPSLPVGRPTSTTPSSPTPTRSPAPRGAGTLRAFTFEYNQRGHQAYRLIEVDTASGQPLAFVKEEAATFYCYYSKKFREDVADGREVIWTSERAR